MTTNHYLAGILLLLIWQTTDRIGPIFGPIGEILGYGYLLIIGAIFALLAIVMLCVYVNMAIEWIGNKIRLSLS